MKKANIKEIIVEEIDMSEILKKYCDLLERFYFIIVHAGDGETYIIARNSYLIDCIYTLEDFKKDYF